VSLCLLGARRGPLAGQVPREGAPGAWPGAAPAAAAGAKLQHAGPHMGWAQRVQAHAAQWPRSELHPHVVLAEVLGDAVAARMSPPKYTNPLTLYEKNNVRQTYWIQRQQLFGNNYSATTIRQQLLCNNYSATTIGYVPFANTNLLQYTFLPPSRPTACPPPAPDVGALLPGAHRPGPRQAQRARQHARVGLPPRPCIPLTVPAGLQLRVTPILHAFRRALPPTPTFPPRSCVPVTVTDDVMQPFEPELDWSAFSVHVAEADIPRMHNLLAAISPARLEQMQVRRACACTARVHARGVEPWGRSTWLASGDHARHAPLGGGGGGPGELGGRCCVGTEYR
jgi:hypothetical protein